MYAYIYIYYIYISITMDIHRDRDSKYINVYIYASIREVSTFCGNHGHCFVQSKGIHGALVAPARAKLFLAKQ